jgi:amino acid transporter
MTYGEAEVELRRDMGLFSATMIGIGAMIGAGIFALTGIAAGQAGPAALFAFALNGVVTLFTAINYAELASAIPEAGGGYSYIRRTMSKRMGFLSGWMLWFAYTVACALYAVAFGGFFWEFVSQHFGGLAGWVVHTFSRDLFILLSIALVSLFFIYLNYYGALVTGMTENVITVAKIVILFVFIAYGVKYLLGSPQELVRSYSGFGAAFPNGLWGVLSAMSLTFIAFEGYDLIATVSEEIKDPKRNIPKAIFLSLGISVLIYLLVVLVALGGIDPHSSSFAAVQGKIPPLTLEDGLTVPAAFHEADPAINTGWEILGVYKETGIVRAAESFMPWFGVTLIIFGGLFSTLSAMNASLLASSRVAFSIARDKFLPRRLSAIHPEKRTPHMAIFTTGAIFLLMALTLPIEVVGYSASLLFLLTFALVNFSAYQIRSAGQVELIWKAPFFPLFPILGILTCIAIALYQLIAQPMAWVLVIAWVAVGMGVFRLYSREKEEVETGKVEMEVSPEEHRIIVPLKDPEHAKPLLTIAASLAKAQKSEIVAVHVVEIPYQTFLHTGKQFIEERMPILDAAVAQGQALGVTVEKKIIISHDVADALVDFAHTVRGNLILMGWTGRISKRKIKRSIPEGVMSKAHCNVAILHPRTPFRLKRILVPIGPGDHLDRIRFVDRIARVSKAQVTFISILQPGADERTKERIREVQERDQKMMEAETEGEIVTAYSVEGILLNRSKGYDLIVIGPSKEWILQDVLFGSVPDKIANEAACSVLMYKEPEQKIESWINWLVEKIRPR